MIRISEGGVPMSDDPNTDSYAHNLNHITTWQDKVDIVWDFFDLVKDIYNDMESGKDVFSNAYEKNQFLSELETARIIFGGIVDYVEDTD